MEKPILFSTPMVRAILNGRKTQTRRIVKPQYEVKDEFTGINKGIWTSLKARGWMYQAPIENCEGLLKVCPYGQIGDVLWCKETWSKERKYPNALEEPNCSVFNYIFKADKQPHVAKLMKWKSPIFMPKEACRIKLLIKDIWVERLQEIIKDENIENIAAEGIPKSPFMIYSDDGEGGYLKDFNTAEFQEEYINLWESINGKGTWEKNPWLWVIEFEKINIK